MSEKRVYVYWDNSNIFISAKQVAQERDGPLARGEVRIHFTNLFRLAVAGRRVAKAVVVGSIPPEHRDLWDRMKNDIGIAPELYERGGMTGTEQGLDQCLQTHMLRAFADESAPQVAVLLTGDGAGYDVGSGFHADLERLHRDGWGVELLAWDLSCRRKLKEWAGQAGIYVPLEEFYDNITFIEGGRSSGPLNLNRRRTSTPGLNRAEKARLEGVREGAAKIAAAERAIADLKQQLEAKNAQDEARRKRGDRYNRRQARIAKGGNNAPGVRRKSKSR